MGQYYTLCSGTGYAARENAAIRSALICAGIYDYALTEVENEQPLSHGASKESTVWLQKNEALSAVSAKILCNRAGKWVASAVAVGIPKGVNKAGIIREFTGYCRKSQAEMNAKQLVREALSSRNEGISRIDVSSAEAMSDGGGYVCCISAVPMWD